jgi:hypothetical protein
MQLRRLYERVPDLVCNKQGILDYGMRLFSIQNQKKPGAGWNGRQIRNAFQSAMALSRYRSSKTPGAPPELLVQDFEEVTKAANEFDDYLYRTRGRYDIDRAKFNQLRAAEKPQAQQTRDSYHSYQPTTAEFRPPAASGERYDDRLRPQSLSYLSPQTIQSQMASAVPSYGSPGMNDARYQDQQAGQQPLGGYPQAPVQGQTYSQPQLQQRLV